MANQHRGVHVVPNHDKGRLDWSVKTEGAQRAYRTFENKADAIATGHRVAVNNKAELFEHNKHGVITDRSSFGNDPRNRKG